MQTTFVKLAYSVYFVYKIVH